MTQSPDTPSKILGIREDERLKAPMAMEVAMEEIILKGSRATKTDPKVDNKRLLGCLEDVQNTAALSRYITTICSRGSFPCLCTALLCAALRY